MNKLTGPGDAAKKFFEFDRDKSGTIDVIEFGNILEAAFRRVPKDELDSIFRTIVRNNKDSLTEEDLRNAFTNKEESLVDTPIVGINDILLPLHTKAKRMGLKPAQLWAQFSKGGKITFEELQSMAGFLLSIQLIPDEAVLLKAFIKEKSASGALGEA